jgi:hypothetical protein
MSTIQFEAKLFTIGAWTLLRLPEHASARLPSRGITMVAGTINGFRTSCLTLRSTRRAPNTTRAPWAERSRAATSLSRCLPQ